MENAVKNAFVGAAILGMGFPLLCLKPLWTTVGVNFREIPTEQLPAYLLMLVLTCGSIKGALTGAIFGLLKSCADRLDGSPYSRQAGGI
jgi:hypothetical protein